MCVDKNRFDGLCCQYRILTCPTALAVGSTAKITRSVCTRTYTSHGIWQCLPKHAKRRSHEVCEAKDTLRVSHDYHQFAHLDLAVLVLNRPVIQARHHTVSVPCYQVPLVMMRPGIIGSEIVMNRPHPIAIDSIDPYRAFGGQSRPLDSF